MAAARNLAIPVEAGDTFSLRCEIRDAPAVTGQLGAPTVLVSPVATWSVGSRPVPVNGETPILVKSTGVGGSGARILQETVNAVQVWVAYADFVTADTQGMTPGVYYWELRIVDGAVTSTPATGSLEIRATITR